MSPDHNLIPVPIVDQESQLQPHSSVPTLMSTTSFQSQSSAHESLTSLSTTERSPPFSIKNFIKSWCPIMQVNKKGVHPSYLRGTKNASRRELTRYSSHWELTIRFGTDGCNIGADLGSHRGALGIVSLTLGTDVTLEGIAVTLGTDWQGHWTDTCNIGTLDLIVTLGLIVVPLGTDSCNIGTSIVM